MLPIIRLLALLAALAAVAPLRAQDVNLLHPVDSLESWLAARPFEIIDFRGSRGEGDRTQRAALEFSDSLIVLAKWARAAPGGERFNNVPRYELAAYAIQRLFLDQPDYVVPPTIARVVPLDWYREKIDPETDPTFDDTASVLVVLQYWLNQVTVLEEFDRDRFDAEPRYSYHVGNLNLVSYVIRHSDSNVGNFLISLASENPRAFAVDNGVAFSMAESNRGTLWREIRVPAVPRATVERLRAITEDDLRRALGVLVQFEVRQGELVAVPPGENLRPDAGVREVENVIQLGLTEGEIGRAYDRIQDLLRDVDRGQLKTF
ncbi:MAG: hypothetical protein ABR527_01485 [Gemmatimonadota bacterium]